MKYFGLNEMEKYMSNKRKSIGKNIIENNILDKIVFFIILLLFVVCVYWIFRIAPYDHATGDDYAWSWRLHRAVVEGTGVIGFIKAMVDNIVYFYIHWQGTWFSGILFGLQPEVFNADWYVITPFVMVFLWVGSLLYFLKVVLVGYCKMAPWRYLTVTMMLFLVSSQYLPASQSAIFWWNGSAHYMIPYSLCLVLLGETIEYLDDFKKHRLVIIWIIATLLGGGNYQVALLCLCGILGFGLYKLMITHFEEKRVHRLWGPIIFESIGLFISMISPGNVVRGGEDFGFYVDWTIYTLKTSTIDAWTWGYEYTVHKPEAVFGMVAILVLLVGHFVKHKDVKIKYWPLVTIGIVVMYILMRAPETYADVTVSMGTYNTNFIVLYLSMLGVFIVLANLIGRLCPFEDIINRGSGMVALLILAFALMRYGVEETVSYGSYEYIKSGDADKFKQDMDTIDALLYSDERNIVVPVVSEEQGPIRHMPYGPDTNGWPNYEACMFFDKDSIVSEY